MMDEAARVSSSEPQDREGFEFEPPGLAATASPLASSRMSPNLLAAFDPADMNEDEQRAVWVLLQYLRRKETAETAEPVPAPGRLVLQDEGGPDVVLDMYAFDRRSRLARVSVRRDVLALYALDLLRAAVRGWQ